MELEIYICTWINP